MKTLILLVALVGQDQPFSDADPAPAIKAARKKAAEENRTVLVLWGANDSEKSTAAAALLKKDKGLKKLLLYEYDLVLADAAKVPGGMAKVMEKIELPWISIHSWDDSSVGYWENPGDATKWTEFLEKNKQKPQVAKDVLAAGMKRATAEKKRVLLTFGAPW